MRPDIRKIRTPNIRDIRKFNVLISKNKVTQSAYNIADKGK